MTKFLIADDDFTIGMQIEEMITALGYDVVGQAGSGQEAVEMARDLRPDIILMDVVMPGELNGIKAAEKIKAELDVPIVFISGHGELDYIQEAKQIEPYGYVMKPFDENEIKAFVEIALHKHKMEKQLKQAHEQLERTNLGLQMEMEARKKTERALRESEKLYRDIFEKNNAIKWLLDPSSGDIVDANPAACEFYQYSHEEITKLRLWDINMEGEAEVKKLLASADSGDKTEFTFKHRLASGEIRYVQIYTGALETGGKKLLHSIIIDITDGKQAEEALRESEERFHHLADASMEAIFFTKDGICLEANQVAVEMFGYDDRSEFIGMFGTEIIAPESHEVVKAHFLNNIFEPYEAIGERKDGTRFPITIQAKAMPYKDKGMVRAASISDITDRKLAEEVLRESEEKLRVIFDTVYSGMILVDATGTITFANRRMAEMFGHDMEEFIGSSYPEYIHESQSDEGKQKMLQLIRGDIDHVFLERLYRKKDGTVFWGHLSGSRLCHLDGSFSSLVGVITDITEKKELAVQLQQAQKMEAIGTLAGGIAHDFNNILGIILGNTELAMDDVPEWNPARNNLDEVKKACMRAKDVVRQILSFSRKSEVEQKPLNIATVVTESLKLLRASIPTSIDIRHNIADDIHDILGDPTQIHQIMINLCTNAAHAMEDDGGTLEVTIENRTIDQVYASKYPELHPGPYVQLRVTDTGDGINPEIIGRVFDPYFTTKDVGKGTGLGLSVVHGIVNSHHGRISVKSEAGKGTAFKLLFPAIERQIPEKSEKLQELPTGTERILFVDDEEPMVKLNQQRLERLGYMVITKTNPSEALEFFRAKPDQIDLVITDMTMPHMTGDRLAEEILKIRRNMSIILCTGYSQRISSERAQELGIRKYIEKPIEMENLARSIREVLDGR